MCDYISLVRWLQSTRNGQAGLYRSAGTQGLTWDVILLVAEAQYGEKALNVSDVCVSMAASKSTVLKLIAQLAEEHILTKKRKKTDSRTQLLRLDDRFRRRLEGYLDDVAVTFPGR